MAQLALAMDLLAVSFGVILLVDVYGFSTQVAFLVLFPMGIGLSPAPCSAASSPAGGVRRDPHNGLVAILPP
ncbi:hypothetical protein [Streptomyces sp. NPDC051909]|uniref:hypothetical protein n=1 Tax=Streptomyces sp. NPDC051909 TaxID=3154944 RepID=UPI00343486D8